MLGKTAGGLYWMFRYLERAENNARLLEVGFNIALTRPGSTTEQWSSIIATAGLEEAYQQRHDEYDSDQVIDFLLRDKTNNSSVLSIIKAARDNARLVRTALTREMWEAVNESWMSLQEQLKRPVRQKDLPDTLALIRNHGALVRGALHGTMLRNDIYNFCRMGAFVERADNTARILDVKYYVLLPSISAVGSPLDNIQWDMILQSVSARRAYHWLHGSKITPSGIADFLIFDLSMPRSLAYCLKQISTHLTALENTYGQRHPCHDLLGNFHGELMANSIDRIFDEGLHEFLEQFIRKVGEIGLQIERDYRFTG